MKHNDFVIATIQIGNISPNTVGIVKNINEDKAVVLFIGNQQTLEVAQRSLSIIDIKRTGKGFDFKICNICAILKRENEFDINQTDAKGNKTTRPSCKSCRVDIDGVPLSTSEKKRMAAIRPSGIFKCPICEKTGIIGITVSIVQDHCHDKGTAREWICDSCNTGLGRFRDSKEILQRAIEYLKKHG